MTCVGGASPSDVLPVSFAVVQMFAGHALSREQQANAAESCGHTAVAMV